MKIKLTEKYKPYSREVGTSCLLPKSPWKVTVYPRLITFLNLTSEKNQGTISVTPHIEGPLSQFTVMQDLDKRWVRVFGRGTEGYFSYRLFVSANEIILFLERCPKKGLAFSYDGEVRVLKSKEELIIPSDSFAFPSLFSEKMHFGCHKASDWTLVKRRLRLDEILPIWFELGKNLPKHPKVEWGNSRFLTQCETLLELKDRQEIGRHLLALFQVGFEGILTPRLLDTGHQGTLSEKEDLPEEASSLSLLREGSRLIRHLLVQEKEKSLEILPCLPVELHAGRFVDVQCRELTLDLEFSKKMIRRLNLHPKSDHICHLTFPSPIQSFRLRTGKRDKGKIYTAGEPLHLKANREYFLDRFQK